MAAFTIEPRRLLFYPPTMYVPVFRGFYVPGLQVNHQGYITRVWVPASPTGDLSYFSSDELRILHAAVAEADGDGLSEEMGNEAAEAGDELYEEMIMQSMRLKSSNHTGDEDGEPEICAICQEDLNDGVIGILGCLHEYHAACIKRWLVVKNVCPVCRGRVELEGRDQGQHSNT